MRREDREVTEPAALAAILARSRVCRVAYVDEQGLTIVPLSFGYEYAAGRLTLFFHSAMDGRKVRAFDQGLTVAFEMDDGGEVTAGETACQYGCRFASLVGRGDIAPLQGGAEKCAALRALMLQQTGRDFTFTEDMTANVRVYRLEAETFCGKQRV